MNALHSSEKTNKQTNKQRETKNMLEAKSIGTKIPCTNFQNFDIPILGDAGADSWGERQTKRAKSVRATGHTLDGCSLFPQVPKVLF